MKKVFIIANGSNDLYYSIKESLSNLFFRLRDFSNMEFYFLYKLSKPNSLGKYINEEICNVKEEGLGKFYNNDINAFIYKDGIITYLDHLKYFDDSGSRQYLSPTLFLDEHLNKEDTNIVIIMGHGGPFQSLLDMTIKPAASINTFILCNKLKEYSIDVLFLDMCAMNYIEVLCELLYPEKIKNIITYTTLAPYIGDSIIPFLESINKTEYIKEALKKFINLSNKCIVLFDKLDLNSMKKLKKYCNLLTIKWISTSSMKENEIIDKVIKYTESIGYIKDNTENKCETRLKILTNYLSNSIERHIYKFYRFSLNNGWAIFVTGNTTKDEMKNSIPTLIDLDIDSIKHIIWLHNPTLNYGAIELIANNLEI